MKGKSEKDERIFDCKECVYQGTFVCESCITSVSPTGKESKPSCYSEDSPKAACEMYQKGYARGFEDAKSLLLPLARIFEQKD